MSRFIELDTGCAINADLIVCIERNVYDTTQFLFGKYVMLKHRMIMADGSKWLLTHNDYMKIVKGEK